ncbi:hypothetical protein [Litoribrevibacter albus]|uniref:Tail assembly chaperone n=1 Tax=Litoribrevibacter albus TaxID=1473156 RepID=A0AA37S9I9_9GAMM|nr:hypothetical protein [Litoribrevibacter albus]GLQ31665.1 hypothetical protein GCM10007876_21440 [Litoribrevibacter albus]
MSVLNKILAANDLKTEEMAVEEWGVTLVLHEFNAAKRGIIASMYRDEELVTKTPYLLMAKTLVLGVSDQNGDDVFSDEAINQVLEKNPQVIERIYDRINKLNGIGPANEEELEKN